MSGSSENHKTTEWSPPRDPNLVYRNGLLVHVGSKWVGGETDDTIEQVRKERTERIIRRSLDKDSG